MFIVFEGIDRSGKSSLSVEFQNWINTEFSDGKGGVTLDPELGPFIWTKEPSFTTAEANRLNGLRSFEDQFTRECMFFESRISHQDYIKSHNIICDRYTWSGMVYAKVYSPGCSKLLRELYRSTKIFKQPDLYIYVNAGIDVCLKRDPSLNMDKMLELWKAYETVYDDIERLDVPIITINSEARSESQDESVQLVLKELAEKFKAHLELVKKLSTTHG
jgi:thymidylate kinase